MRTVSGSNVDKIRIISHAIEGDALQVIGFTHEVVRDSPNGTLKLYFGSYTQCLIYIGCIAVGSSHITAINFANGRYV